MLLHLLDLPASWQQSQGHPLHTLQEALLKDLLGCPSSQHMSYSTPQPAGRQQHMSQDDLM
jgi:hypothetical protein